MPQMVLALAIPVWLQHGIETYGYWVILTAVALESLGVPFPGETSLLAGSIYAATTGRIDIVLVIVAAAAGAILGDNIGYTIGYFGGYPLLRAILRRFHIRESRARFAQDYFAKHGDKTVFLGRFFSLLRLWVAFLAGVNRMPRLSFLFWNAFGGIVWAIFYGVLGYVLGHNVALLDRVLTVMGAAGVVAIGIVVAGLLALWLLQRRRRHTRLNAPPTAAPTEAGQPPSHTPERRIEPDTDNASDTSNTADTATRG